MPLSQNDDDAGRCRLTWMASIDLTQDRPVENERLLCRIYRFRGGIDNESISSLQHPFSHFTYELVCSIDGRRCRRFGRASCEQKILRFDIHLIHSALEDRLPFSHRMLSEQRKEPTRTLVLVHSDLLTASACRSRFLRSV